MQHVCAPAVPEHTAVVAHLQSTEPHVLVTVLPHELPHVGSAQQVLPAPLQALPPPQSVPHALEPQAFVSVMPHWPLQTGRAQHVLLATSQDLPLPQDVLGQVREPQALVSVVLQAPLQTGRSQHMPVTAPVAFLHVWLPQPHESVPPQPSSSVPHWPG